MVFPYKKRQHVVRAAEAVGAYLDNASSSGFRGSQYVASTALASVSIRDAVKSAFDVSAAAGLLLLFSPIMLLVTVAIKLDSKGSVLFKQERSGQNGVPFVIYKFRTMVQHDTPKHMLDYVKQDDPRVTRMGKFLRKTSLDELPQLFNVLKGELSMVGPRPQPSNYLDHYGAKIKGYKDRLAVKPGVTGPVQVSNLRAQVDTLYDIQRRVDMENFYIQNQSLWLDVKLCVATAVMVLARRYSDIYKMVK